MDRITHQVRAEYWAKILNECMNSGMNKTAWCKANGISDKQFFYWQRILRREAFESSQNADLPVVPKSALPLATENISFAEVKLPSAEKQSEMSFVPDVVIRKGNLILEISNSASEALLSRIGGILHVE